MHDQLVLEAPHTAGATMPAVRVDAPALRVRRVERRDVPLLLRLCEAHATAARAERAAYGAPRWSPLELIEALCDAPVRAWAWIAEVGADAVGYAGASAGCSFLERANYLVLESLYARPSRWAVQVERELFAQALRTARELGCLNLQWRLPPAQASRLCDELPSLATRVESLQYVLPLSESRRRPHD